ncbi:MAG TPA: transcriptional repressor [Actinomycetes bacterium]|nr:transcriptional repressor [Actinomycetes bacterium]
MTTSSRSSRSAASTSSPRSTRQRRAVRELMDSLDEFSSAQEIHARLRDAGSNVGLTTVYRTLQSMAQAGEVDVLRPEDGEARYRSCTSAHHHHLMCRACGRTLEVDSPTVERWAERVATDHGFTEISHTLEIFGLCSDCNP